jgi:site-specific recombinase XerD
LACEGQDVYDRHKNARIFIRAKHPQFEVEREPHILGKQGRPMPIGEEDIEESSGDEAKHDGVLDIPNIHSLRHSCATFLLAQGVPMYVIKDILGHSQISTTMRYTHPTSETMRDAAAEMDVLFPEDQADKQEEKEEE